MPQVQPDGTLSIDAFELPPSAGWSDEARKVFLRRFGGPPVSAQAIVGRPDAEAWLASARAFRVGMEQLHGRLLSRIAEDHPADVTEAELAGVPVRWVTPRSGVRHPDRVLINLHGGAFVGGAEHCGLVESLPLADVGGYRVCVVDYRQGWEHRFPAASEDVAAVLTALQADRSPTQLGVFGYSAGGMLAAQAIAWCQAHDIAPPAAAAICSAGAGGTGDSAWLAQLAMGGAAPAAGATDDSTVALGGHTSPAPFGYAADVDPADPLLSPISSASVMARFPPTLLLTGTRSFDLSSALRTHRALLAAGATAELHCFEGMWHCFPYNHRMPEAKDAFATITRFFDRHLS